MAKQSTRTLLHCLAFFFTLQLALIATLPLQGQVIYANTVDSIYKIIITPSGCIFKPSGYSCPAIEQDYMSIALFKDTMYITDDSNLNYMTLSSPDYCTEIIAQLSGNSMVADSNGILYIANGNTIDRFDPYTRNVTVFSGFLFNSSGDLAFYRGKLYMAADSINTPGPDLLVEVNIDSPELSKPVIVFNDGSVFALASSEGKCGSDQLFAIVNTNNGSLLESLDPDNGTRQVLCNNLPYTFNDAASPGETQTSSGVDIEQLNIQQPCYLSTTPSRVSIEAYGINGRPLNYLLSNGQQNNSGIFEGLPEGHYSMHISYGDNCSIDTSFTISQMYCNKLLEVPSGFTPNHDGINDRLRPLGALPVGGFYFAVFNRWGQKIFETQDQSTGWDGSFHGVPQSSGTYIWMLQYKDANNKLVTDRGTTVLLR
ncbi:MAG TPA: gliding motility-associated C-terminal domain-containing protein [Puia sp.]|jgi:gliding motility-associated-like protein|nr:gliding motility-associated C-terminal domain-containing protein [Puia sp.]